MIAVFWDDLQLESEVEFILIIVNPALLCN